MVKKIAWCAALLGILLASSPASPELKFGTGGGSIKKALREGKIEEALAYYEFIAAESEKKASTNGSREDWTAASEAYSAASHAARYLGDLQKANDYGYKALEIAQKIRNAAQEVNAINKLVGVYAILRDWETVRELVGGGLEILRKKSTEIDMHLSFEAVFNLRSGESFIHQRRFEGAVPKLSKSLALFEAYLSKLQRLEGNKQKSIKIENQRGLIVWSHVLMGRAYHGMGKLKHAMDQLQEGLRRIQEWKLKTHFDRHLYVGLGELHEEQGDYPEALRNYEGALAILEDRNRPAMLAGLYQKIGDLYLKTKKFPEAVVYYREAIQRVESTRSVLDSQIRQSFFGTKIGSYVGIIGALQEIGKPEVAFNYNERARSRHFLDILGNKVELSKSGSQLQEEEKALGEQIGAIKAKQARNVHRRVLRKDLREARKSYKAFLAKVREVDDEQASLLTVQPLALKEVQGLLDPGTALIEYFVTDSEVHIWVVEKNKAQSEIVRLTKEKLTNLVKDLRQKITSLEKIDNFNKTSAEIYQALVQPVLPHLSGSQLIIVPHDVLHYLPFQALVSPEGRYLVEDYPIHYLSSASLMKFTTAKKRGARGDRVLAIGNPDSGNSKPGLKYAELEARLVKSLYPRSTLLLNSDATKETVKSESARHDILHFAAHAELSKDDPLSSAILLAKDGKDDGRLTVKEIFEMELNADLVVLSGCETGLGKLSRGDEMVGLTRAFIYAGTPSVVASLWKVEDQSTAALMGSFYKNLKTMSKAEALRQAQLELIRGKVGADLLAMRGVGGITKSGEVSGVKASSPGSVPVSVSSSTSLSQGSVPVSSAHPYFWAPFVLVGDGK